VQSAPSRPATSFRSDRQYSGSRTFTPSSGGSRTHDSYRSATRSDIRSSQTLQPRVGSGSSGAWRSGGSSGVSRSSGGWQSRGDSAGSRSSGGWHSGGSGTRSSGGHGRR
jgi:hypothetical protein